jgi:hypothetical protein
MFRAVRSWWGSGQGRRTARLFAFEFLVVMAGVLAAQGLQNWAARRADREEGAAQVEIARRNIQSLGGTIAFWTHYGPCLRDHARGIAAKAAAGRSLGPRQIGRPALPVIPITSWTEEGRQHAALAIGDEALARLVVLNATAATASAAEEEISREWAMFRLLDPAMGQLMPEDRARVRQAAAVIDNRIGFLVYTHAQLIRVAGQAGVPVQGSPPSALQSRVDQCGLLKDWQ